MSASTNLIGPPILNLSGVGGTIVAEIGQATFHGAGISTKVVMRVSASQGNDDLLQFHDVNDSVMAYVNKAGNGTFTELLVTSHIIKWDDNWQISADVAHLGYLRDPGNNRTIITMTPGAAGSGGFRIDESVLIVSPHAGQVCLQLSAFTGQSANIFVCKNASNVNVFAVAADGTINQSGEIVHSGATGLNHNSKWREYSPDTEFYIRDLVNGRMQMDMSPGASNSAAVTTFNSKLVAIGGAVLMPTGASKTVDEVITAIQSIGLFKQS